MSRTIAEREAMAREHECPRCHAGPGSPCRARAVRGLRPPMKSVHPQRMALLPFELDWHRAKLGGGRPVQRAIDHRVTPAVVYEIGREDDPYGPYGAWYVACWPEGVTGTAVQRKTGLSSMHIAKRAASHSRCASCYRHVMFGDLEPRGHGMWQCRDRGTCDAIAAERNREEREQLEAAENRPWDEITIRPGPVVPELAFTDKTSGNSTIVRIPPGDIDRLADVLATWKKNRQLDPEWTWS